MAVSATLQDLRKQNTLMLISQDALNANNPKHLFKRQSTIIDGESEDELSRDDLSEGSPQMPAKDLQSPGEKFVNFDLGLGDVKGRQRANTIVRRMTTKGLVQDNDL